MRILLALILLSSSLAYGQTVLELPEIGGPVTHHKPPKGWEIHTGSPDVVTGPGPYFNDGYDLEYIEGPKYGKTMVWMMCTRPNNPEAMKTTVKVTKGDTYKVSIMWQQMAMMDGNQRKYWGGDLEMTVQGKSKIFTSEGLVDGWQEATMVFTAKSDSVTVIVGMHDPDKDPKSDWGGSIVVDNYCESCIEPSQEKLEAGGTFE